MRPFAPSFGTLRLNLKVDGNNIRNSSNSTIAKMSDVTGAIQGAKPEAVYVALWWFIVKGNK